MSTRTYDYILTINSVSGSFQKGNTIIGSSGTSATIANVTLNSNSTVNLKVKVDNVYQEFSNSESILSNNINTTGGSSINTIPYVPPTPASGNTTTATGTIIDITNSNYIREKNSFIQNPIVRLYTVYYPGEWYPPNEAGNPSGGKGEGRAWPDGFPLRFAEIRGDLNADISYNVEFGTTNYTPIPINSGGISTDSTGTINDITVDISNFDNLITQLVENPDLVGNNISNAVFAVVNGEIVNGIDPRTVPTGATYSDSEQTAALSRARSNGLNYSQSVVDSYGRQNASFTITTTESVNGTWKREKADSRDLLGAVVEIKSTFANFLDYWPEYAKVDASFSNVIEVSTALPYRVGDNVKSRSNSTIAQIQAIEENRFIFTDTQLDLTVGEPLLIDNVEKDDEAYVKDTFKIDALSSLTDEVASFSLTSWLQYFKLTLPRRKYYKNTCQWVYKGAECQYPGPGGLAIPGTNLTSNANPIAANNQVAGSQAEDECAKSFEACSNRNNTIHFGGFPGTGRTIPK